MSVVLPLKKVTEVHIGDKHTRVTARGTFTDKDALDFVPTPESVFFHIDTPNYDGPLDLLLHLIRKHSMDIFDIPITLITQKYLAALDEMVSLNLDIAGEFILMAATLAQIKSKTLLPKEEQIVDPEDDGLELDPRAALMRRLLIYQTFQEAAVSLNSRPHLGRDFFKSPPIETPKPTDFSAITLASREIFDLLDSLSTVLKKSEDKVVHTITRDRISISARIHELMDFCTVRTQFTFIEAVAYFPIYEKVDVIVTFLALLEMTRLKLLRLDQMALQDITFKIAKETFYQEQSDILQNLAKVEENYEH
jgi:segregation and condensation protein A